MTFKPLNDRVAVQRVEQEEKSSGGIIIPDTAQEKPQECVIVAVGPGSLTENGQRVPMDVKVGDRVLIGKWAGTEVKRADGSEILIVKESDILAVVSS